MTLSPNPEVQEKMLEITQMTEQLLDAADTPEQRELFRDHVLQAVADAAEEARQRISQ